MTRLRIVRERVAVAGALDLHRTAGFLFRRGPDLRRTGLGLRGVVRAGRGLALVEIEPATGAVDITLRLSAGAEAAAALGSARQLAGLPRDPARADAFPAFLAAARADPAMARVLESCPGLRLPQRPDPVGTVVGAILAQQVTGTFAAELNRRVREKWGERVLLAGEEWELAPRAEVLAEVEPEFMRPLQISQRKAEYIRDLCREIAAGTLDLPALAAQPIAAASTALEARRGVGPTTAAWLLAFGAGHPDAWPPADVGIWRALDELHGRNEGPSITRWLGRYAGARSFLAVHLWEGMRLGVISR